MPVKHDVTYLPSIGTTKYKLFFTKNSFITTYLVSLLLYKIFDLSPFCQSAMTERTEKIKIILIQVFLDFKGSKCSSKAPSINMKILNQLPF
jgi:hypothetical protein